MILCSQTYCYYPPKYLVDTRHSPIQLMCGKCLNTRKNWLDTHDTFNLITKPNDIEITREQYHEEYIALQFYKLSKLDIEFLGGLN